MSSRNAGRRRTGERRPPAASAAPRTGCRSASAYLARQYSRSVGGASPGWCSARVLDVPRVGVVAHHRGNPPPDAAQPPSGRTRPQSGPLGPTCRDRPLVTTPGAGTAPHPGRTAAHCAATFFSAGVVMKLAGAKKCDGSSGSSVVGMPARPDRTNADHDRGQHHDDHQGGEDDRQGALHKGVPDDRADRGRDCWPCRTSPRRPPARRQTRCAASSSRSPAPGRRSSGSWRSG